MSPQAANLVVSKNFTKNVCHKQSLWAVRYVANNPCTCKVLLVQTLTNSRHLFFLDISHLFPYIMGCIFWYSKCFLGSAENNMFWYIIYINIIAVYLQKDRVNFLCQDRRTKPLNGIFDTIWVSYPMCKQADHWPGKVCAISSSSRAQSNLAHPAVVVCSSA